MLANGANAGHETAAIGPQNSSIRCCWGADHENVDESAALCCAQNYAQSQREAGARQVGRSRGAKAGHREDAASPGADFSDAAQRIAAAPLDREVERNSTLSHSRSPARPLLTYGYVIAPPRGGSPRQPSSRARPTAAPLESPWPAAVLGAAPRRSCSPADSRSSRWSSWCAARPRRRQVMEVATLRITEAGRRG